MNDWWVLNMMFIIMWCIFSFTWIVRIIWTCWTTMVMLLVFIYVCVHICYWWIFLHACVGEIIGKCMYFYSRWNCGEYMHSWLSHMFIHHMLSQMFTSILSLTGYLYPYSRWNYSCWQWCSVGIRGDDLEGDLVPHVSRIGLGTLHV